MFWREDDEKKTEYRVPEDIFDLVFRLRGVSVDIDHAHALAQALGQLLPAEVCARVGVHGVRLAESGNGWTRPQQQDAAIPLSRRARLAIRVHRDDAERVVGISRKILQLGEHRIEIGESAERPLSLSGTLYARAVVCDRTQPEDDFLAAVAAQLLAMDIDVGKMICGRSGEIRTGDDNLFTRALLIAGLKAEESVSLQRSGIGDHRLVGCGLFVPYKGIEAVYSKQE